MIMMKVRRFNPVDYMTSDEEIIDFLVESYKDDPTGMTYQGALKFVMRSCGLTKAFALNFRVIRIISDESRSTSTPPVEKPASMKLQHAY